MAAHRRLPPPRPGLGRTLRAGLALGLLLVPSCTGSADPEPLRAPPVVTSVQHFRGLLLSGPVDPGIHGKPEAETPTAPADVPVEDLLVVRCSIVYLAELPESLPPLASRSRLVVGVRGDEALLPTAVLAPEARVGFGSREQVLDESAEWLPVDRLAGLLPPETSVVFSGSGPKDQQLAEGEMVDRQLGVIVSRPSHDDGLEVSLLIEDFTPLDPAAPTVGDAEPTILQRQLMVLEDHPQPAGQPLALLFRSPFSEREGAGFGVFLEIDRADRDTGDLEQLISSCTDDIELSATDAISRAMRVGRPEAEHRSLHAGLASLSSDAPSRRTVVYLAERSTTRLALDLALGAEDEVLGTWITRWRTGEDGNERPVPRKADSSSNAAIGWDLERSAYLELADRLDRGELPNDLHGILVVHAGEAASSGPVLRGAVQRARDLESLETELIRENRAALRSADPADRVRAHDWLELRDAAVPGYAPLATRDERRQALREDAERREREAAGEEGQR